MCNVIYSSTTSTSDLGALGSGLFHFVNARESDPTDALSLLAYPNKWALQGRYGGCSCHFRVQLTGCSMCFQTPQDWCPEDAEDVESTAAVYEVFKQLVEAGHKLDILDYWNGKIPAEPEHLKVSLSQVSGAVFRFYQGYRFEIVR